MTDETAIREDLMRLETTKAQLEALVKQQEVIQVAIEEHVKARETVKNLAEQEPGNEVMVPIGADSYIYARTSETKDVVVGAGSTVSVQRTAQEAEKILDSRIEELSQTFKKVAERVAQADAAIQQLSAKIEEQYAEMQAAQQI